MLRGVAMSREKLRIITRRFVGLFRLDGREDGGAPGRFRSASVGSGQACSEEGGIEVLAVGSQCRQEAEIFVTLRKNQIDPGRAGQALSQEISRGVGELPLGGAVAVALGRIDPGEPDRKMLPQHGGQRAIREGHGAGVAIVTIVHGDGDKRGFPGQMEW